MLAGKMLRNLAIVALIFFVGVSVTANYSFASEEDNLLKARRLYQEGDYEGAVKILNEFVENLRAIVAQKKNVAEAFYLMARVYYTVGDDRKVDENLIKVFETFPAFTYDEADYDFKNRVDTAKKLVMSERAAQGLEGTTDQDEAIQQEPAVEEETVQPREQNVITSPPKTKKKKFPVLLVVGGIAVLVVLAAVLLGGKKAKDEFDIRGNWIINEEWPRYGSFTTFTTFSGSLTSGTLRNNDGMTGTYVVAGKDVFFKYNDYEKWEYNGLFSSIDNMRGTGVVLLDGGDEIRGAWTARRGGEGANTVSRSSQPLSSVVKNKK